MVKNELFADFCGMMLFQYDVCLMCTNLQDVKTNFQVIPESRSPAKKREVTPLSPSSFTGSQELCAFFSGGGEALRPFFV